MKRINKLIGLCKDFREFCQEYKIYQKQSVTWQGDYIMDYDDFKESRELGKPIYISTFTEYKYCIGHVVLGGFTYNFINNNGDFTIIDGTTNNDLDYIYKKCSEILNGLKGETKIKISDYARHGIYENIETEYDDARKELKRALEVFNEKKRLMDKWEYKE